MSTIGYRLKEARETAHQRMGRVHEITWSELSQMIGVSAEAVYREERSSTKRGELSPATLMEAAKFLRCSFVWLVTGHGNMLDDDERLVELLEGQCGQPFYFPDEIGRSEPSSDMRLNVPDHLAKVITPSAFYTVVTDNALQPTVSAGDLVLVDAGQTLESGEYVLVKLEGSSLPVVRRFTECNEEGLAGYQLRSLNDEFAHRPFPGMDSLVGVVMEFRHFPNWSTGYKDRLKRAAFGDKVVTLRH